MAGKKKEQRPFRIFDEAAKMDMPRRAYCEEGRAIDKCLTILWRLPIGESYTVYDARSSRAILQVTRKVDALQFYYDEKRAQNHGIATSTRSRT